MKSFMAHKKGGFTLIELLVVISIIGLLSSIIIGRVNNARKKAQIAAFTETMSSIQKAMELYYLSNNSYPVSGGGADYYWDSGGPQDNGFISPMMTSLVSGKFLASIPNFPAIVSPWAPSGYFELFYDLPIDNGVNGFTTTNGFTCGTKPIYQWQIIMDPGFSTGNGFNFPRWNYWQDGTNGGAFDGKIQNVELTDQGYYCVSSM
jgi:prepilin-type N-terminal cleavage/methylation domain-containing protein